MALQELIPPEWNVVELRVLVILSLILQIVLIATGTRRKYRAKKVVALIPWLAYLSADPIATLALGILSRANASPKHDPRNTITAFWAPFLLLHLGGPDTITAYALADNELWLRHLIGLIVQVVVVLYVSHRYFTHAFLNYLSIVIFLAGFIKYGERIWVLFTASKDQYRDSLVSKPDPGPNYAKFMDELVSREQEGYRISLGKAIDANGDWRLCPEETDHRIPNSVLLQKAYDFFETFKKLFADLILSFQDLENSVSYFKDLIWKDAFNIVEIELGLVFDLFYTKSHLVFSKTGVFLRIFSCLSTIAVFIAFHIIDKNDYPKTEVNITYILLAGAIFLEIYAVILLFLSDRMMILLKGSWTTRHKVLRLLRLVPAGKRWSNSVGQYSVLNHCLNDMVKHPKLYKYPVKLYRYLKTNFFWRSEPVGDQLKKLIFDELKKRYIFAQGHGGVSVGENREKVNSYWTDNILKEMNVFNARDEVAFDQSLLLWHIATDYCFHMDLMQSNFTRVVKLKSEDCILLSNYMVHLLILSPFMLPSGIGKIRFQDTCAEADEFFNHEKKLTKGEACEMLSEVDTRFIPSDVKGDRSKSLLFDARRLARSLNDLDVGQRWEKITQAWLDILTFSAAQCSWSDHAEKLSQGGELLTHVWLLMAHFGMTDQFQITQGYMRAKLVLK